MADIGLIGIGLVGTALAERLLSAGHGVTGYDLSQECRARLKVLRGIAVDSAVAAAASSSVIVLSLPNSNAVDDVIREIESVARGRLIVDTTTGDPDQTSALGQRLKEIGVEYVDATIAGSSRQVREGQVVVIVGGEPDIVERCTWLFDLFAARVFHVGPWGSGARMKLVVNLFLGLNRAVLAEGLAFARALKLEPAAALDVLKAGPAYSQVMDTKGQKMIDRDFSVEARLSQHLKDVRLILAAAESNGIELPLSGLHSQLLERLEEMGYGGEDNSAIIRAYQRESPS